MGPILSIREWFKYQQLKHYPELSHLPRDVALQRLKAVERVVLEERESSHRFMAAIVFAGWAAAVALAFLSSRTSIQLS